MTESDLRRKVATTICGWYGAAKGSPQHKAIIDLYNTIDPLPRGVRMSYEWDWCAATVSAAFQAAGLIHLIPPECSCSLMVKGAQSMGIWVEDDSYMPEVGDIILYDWKDKGKGDDTGAPNHVGIVVGADDPAGLFKVVEGNAGSESKVAARNMVRNGRYIRGFITPKYADEKEKAEPWYKEAMDWAWEMDLMDGTRPLDTVTRAELATVAMRLYHKCKEAD